MLINLQSQAVTLGREDGTVFELPASSEPAWIESAPGPLIAEIEGIQVYGPPKFDRVVGIPDPSPDVYYIVSVHVARRCAHRDDVFYVDGDRLISASPAVRIEDRLSERAKKVFRHLGGTAHSVSQHRRSTVRKMVSVGKLTVAELDKLLDDCGLSWAPED